MKGDDDMSNFKEKEMNENLARELEVDGSSISTTASIIGMILTTIALGGMRTYWVAALAAVAVGIALLVEAAVLNSRVSPLMSFRDRSASMVVAGRILGGVAGITLGVLSLFGVLARLLLPLSSVIFGLVLTLGSWSFVRLNDVYTVRACEKDETRAMLRAVVRIIGSLDMFIGFASIALGILALTEIGLVPVTLSLVATFGIGFSSFLKGTIFSGSVLSKLYCDKLQAV